MVSRGDNMARKSGLYRCNVCGNVVSVVIAGEGDLVCCDEEMQLLEEKTAEKEGKEKHVPVIEKDGKRVKVKVGSVPHPMEEKHYIALIEIMGDGEVIASARLYPGEKPEAEFELEKTEGIYAREFCNIHGLWRS